MAAHDHAGSVRPILPSRATAQNGVVFKPCEDVWNIRALARDLRIDLRDLPGAHPDLIPSVKATLFWFAKHRAPSTLHNVHQLLRGFFREMSRQQGTLVDAITDVLLINYRSSLNEKERWRLSALSSPFTKWHELGYPGVEKNAAQFLKSMRHERPAAGTAVLTMDPVLGPFTDIELESIQRALTDAFAAGALALGDFLATNIFMLTGARAPAAKASERALWIDS